MGWRRSAVSGNCQVKILSPLSRPFCAANQSRTFSITIPSSLSEDTATMTGEECYLRALDALERAKVARTEKETKRSAEQYEAWQKAQEAEKKGRRIKDGVAVVKTIAKQARRQETADQNWEEQAQFWMMQAALEHGHATALVRLGNAALEKANSSTDVEEIKEFTEKAMEYYEMAGEKGSAEGYFNLGHLLWSEDRNEQDGVIKKDNKESIKSFYKAIDLGDRDAMFFVGVQLLSDDDSSSVFEEEYSSLVERYRAGLDLIERSASLEHGGALYYLSLLHLNGHEELQIPACTPKEFRGRLDAAANAGDPDALFLRGHSFYHGDDGYKQDYESALQNFLAAAEAGNSDAAVSAGAMLHQGIGVRKDQRRAFELYQAAGELGNVEGWRNVVACYALGEGVPQSEEMAKYITKTVLKYDK
jgi:TPR repeat protein